MKASKTKMAALVTLSLMVVLQFQNCAANKSSAAELASQATSCWNKVDVAASLSINSIDRVSVQLSGLNTSMPTLQADNGVMSCNSSDISTFASFTKLRNAVNGLSLCTGDLGGGGDQISTDVGGNNKADSTSVKPNGITYVQLKTIVNELMSQANLNGDCR